jgi:hypothetical protein
LEFHAIFDGSGQDAHKWMMDKEKWAKKGRSCHVQVRQKTTSDGNGACLPAVQTFHIHVPLTLLVGPNVP